MTVERSLLDSVTDQQWLCKLALAGGSHHTHRDRGHRGIGLFARTMAQQLAPQVESATAPFQYALSTRAGSECVAHVIQGLSELDPDSTVMSIDGISAYDQISRAAMLDGLHTHCGGETIPFVRMFYGSPSTDLWEDAEGVEHSILQGELGEQGDPLMPLLYSLGQHGALEATRGACRRGEFGRVPRRPLGCVASPRVGQSRVWVFAAQFVFPRTDSSPWRQDTGLEPERNQT